MNTRTSFLSSTLPALLLASLAACGSVDVSQPEENAGEVTNQLSDDAGAVYAMTNDQVVNSVVYYARHANGKLERMSSTATGGRGTGKKQLPALTNDSVDPLVSAHSLVVDKKHRFAFAANAGDGSVSVFKIDRHGDLELLSRRVTGGLFPNSIATQGDNVYVSHAGNAGAGVPSTIAAFRVDHRGTLTPICAPQELSNPGASQGADAVIADDGRHLIVTDIATNQLAVFPIRTDGSLAAPTFNASAGANPFGMAVSSSGVIVVTEAQGVVTGAATVSSYRLRGDSLVPVSSAIPNGQTAACWVSISPEGQFAYTSNTADNGGDGDISIYSIASNGKLTLVNAIGALRQPPAGALTSGPVDSIITPDGRFLYQQWGGLGLVGAYAIGAHGTLTPVPDGDGLGLPLVATQGLAGF